MSETACERFTGMGLHAIKRGVRSSQDEFVCGKNKKKQERKRAAHVRLFSVFCKNRSISAIRIKYLSFRIKMSKNLLINSKD